MELTDSVSTGLTKGLHERAERYVPGGVHSSSRLRRPHPIFAARASGPYLWDVDGVQYLDLQMGSGSVALGHGREEVDAAVTEMISAGLTTGVETTRPWTRWRRSGRPSPSVGRCALPTQAPRH